MEAVWDGWGNWTTFPSSSISVSSCGVLHCPSGVGRAHQHNGAVVRCLLSFFSSSPSPPCPQLIALVLISVRKEKPLRRETPCLPTTCLLTMVARERPCSIPSQPLVWCAEPQPLCPTPGLHPAFSPSLESSCLSFLLVLPTSMLTLSWA